MRPIDYALQQFAAKGYKAHDLQIEAKTIQFTLTGEHQLPSTTLGQVMRTAFEKNIYAFAASGNSTTVKILL